MISRMLFNTFVTLCLALVFLRAQALSEPQSTRSKTLNFEEDVVEGINRKPLDSVAQVSELDGHTLHHLYKRRATFSDRDELMIQAIHGGKP